MDDLRFFGSLRLQICYIAGLLDDFIQQLFDRQIICFRAEYL